MPVHNWTYRLSAAGLLILLLSAYAIRSWHDPALHHHPHCSAENSLHWHIGEEECSLCDFTFSYRLSDDLVWQLAIPESGNHLIPATEPRWRMARPSIGPDPRGPPNQG